MTLTEQQYYEFLKTHLGLLYYVGQKTNVIKKQTTYKDFTKLSLKDKILCRRNINPFLIENYLKENSLNLSLNEIDILKGFKRKIYDDFLIYKCLKNHAIFLRTETNKFYTVKALSDRFDEMLIEFPVLIKTTILPFKDFIIYDGFIESYNTYIGPQMTSEIKEEYKIAKANNLIIRKITN